MGGGLRDRVQFLLLSRSGLQRHNGGTRSTSRSSSQEQAPTPTTAWGSAPETPPHSRHPRTHPPVLQSPHSCSQPHAGTHPGAGAAHAAGTSVWLLPRSAGQCGMPGGSWGAHTQAFWGPGAAGTHKACGQCWSWGPREARGAGGPRWSCWSRGSCHAVLPVRPHGAGVPPASLHRWEEECHHPQTSGSWLNPESATVSPTHPRFLMELFTHLQSQRDRKTPQSKHAQQHGAEGSEPAGGRPPRDHCRLGEGGHETWPQGGA